jgi:hypothetical protein
MLDDTVAQETIRIRLSSQINRIVLTRFARVCFGNRHV